MHTLIYVRGKNIAFKFDVYAKISCMRTTAEKADRAVNRIVHVHKFTCRNFKN